MVGFLEKRRGNFQFRVILDVFRFYELIHVFVVNAFLHERQKVHIELKSLVVEEFLKDFPIV